MRASPPLALLHQEPSRANLTDQKLREGGKLVCSLVGSDTLEVLSGTGFLTGLLVGGIGSFLVWLVAAQGSDRKTPVAGLVLVLAALLALPSTSSVPVELWVGCGLLAALTLIPSPRGLNPIKAVPGAWFVVFSTDVSEEAWIRWFVFGAILVSAPLVADFDKLYRRDTLALPLFAVSVAGVFLTVPDTEQAVVLLGVALPFALLGWPRPIAALGTPGAFAAVGLFLWVAAAGGAARSSAIIGGATCLGLMLVEPLARWLSKTGTNLRIRGPMDVLAIGSAHGLIVLFASRVAGLRSSAGQAALIASSLLIIATWLLTRADREHA